MFFSNLNKTLKGIMKGVLLLYSRYSSPNLLNNFFSSKILAYIKIKRKTPSAMKENHTFFKRKEKLKYKNEYPKYIGFLQ
jgi:hypothetical protein